MSLLRWREMGGKYSILLESKKMKDSFKEARRLLRPGYSFEFKGKADKNINRRICRKRLKRELSKMND